MLCYMLTNCPSFRDRVKATKKSLQFALGIWKGDIGLFSFNLFINVYFRANNQYIYKR